MKVVYEKTIVDLVLNAKEEANSRMKKIHYIELTEKEATEALKYTSHSNVFFDFNNTPPRKFKFFGVDIKVLNE